MRTQRMDLDHREDLDRPKDNSGVAYRKSAGESLRSFLWRDGRARCPQRAGAARTNTTTFLAISRRAEDSAPYRPGNYFCQLVQKLARARSAKRRRNCACTLMRLIFRCAENACGVSRKSRITC